MKLNLITYYAPPERATEDEIAKQVSVISKLDIERFLNAVPDVYCILNKNRQIVFANQAIINLLKAKDDSKIIGKRPGEVLNCKNSIETEAGCGTAEACRTCGAVNAILASQKGKPDVQECRLTDKDTKEASDYRVWTNPIRIDGDEYVIFAVSDISNEKRRQALERIFFHDVMNTAGVLRGFVSLIVDYPDEFDEYKGFLVDISNNLIEEIRAQRDLIAAENNELQVHPENISSKDIIGTIATVFKTSEISKGKIIVVTEDIKDVNFVSDRTLITRTLTNMLKNALEASSENQTITLNSYLKNRRVVFSVHNPNFMERNIQLQIFQRSFTTKGLGRGLGTYSMKLITEKYLKGKVYFKTDEEAGTTFYCELPLRI